MREGGLSREPAPGEAGGDSYRESPIAGARRRLALAKNCIFGGGCVTSHEGLAQRLQGQGRVSEQPVDFRQQFGGRGEGQFPGKGQTRLFPRVEEVEKHGNWAVMPAENPF